MADAYVKDILANSPDSHQTSPGYVLTMLRWSKRDTKNYTNLNNRFGSPVDNLDLRKPLVVINDAISVNVSNTKSGMSPSLSVVLKGGDLNYATAVHPGDFILVNMLNWESDVKRVYSKAVGLKPINEYGDGFKGVFKIQSIVKTLQIDPNSGVKTLLYTIQAAGFTEFNNVIYYNPGIAAEAANNPAATGLYQSQIGEYYTNLLKTNAGVQTIIIALFRILIGKTKKSKDIKVKNFGNNHFQVPGDLGKLMGKPGAETASEIFNYIVGIWKDSRKTGAGIGENFNPGFELDPDERNSENTYTTGKDLQGNKQIFLENWNQVTSWSVIQQNINSTLNEMYTTYRLDKFNKVMPTVVVRQKPFTTDHFSPGEDVPSTRFMGLPRWRVSSNLLLSLQLSKNDAARFNFVQIYTRAFPGTFAQDMVEQIREGNIVSDREDIVRNGLRPYVMTSNFDFPISNGKETVKKLHAVPWTKLISDWIINGHLKESGKMSFIGLQDPISVGDNLEFDNVVYHIESVNHNMQITSGGKKQFRTSVTVSYGMDIRSNSERPVYANMEHTDAYTQNLEDFDNERILPGVGEAQNIPGRERFSGEEVNETKQASFTQDPASRKKRAVEPNTGIAKRGSKGVKDHGGKKPIKKNIFKKK